MTTSGIRSTYQQALANDISIHREKKNNNQDRHKTEIPLPRVKNPGLRFSIFVVKFCLIEKGHSSVQWRHWEGSTAGMSFEVNTPIKKRENKNSRWQINIVYMQ